MPEVIIVKLPQAFWLEQIKMQLKKPLVYWPIAISLIAALGFAAILAVSNRTTQVKQTVVRTATVQPITATPPSVNTEPASPPALTATQPSVKVKPVSPRAAKVKEKPKLSLTFADFQAPLQGQLLRKVDKNLVWWTTLADYRSHPGTDIAIKEGSAVHAAASGTVSELGNDPVYGNSLVIDHGDGWKTVYSQLKDIRVKLNEHVKKGQILAVVGLPSGGEADMPAHLHFEIWHNGHVLSEAISK